MKGTQKDRELRRIRNRTSYILFQELYDFLNEKPSAANILRKFHGVLDAKRSYGSERNAEYAAESLELVLKDNDSVAPHSQPNEKHKKACAFDCMGDGNSNNT